jgi:hypothetical protein
MKKKLPHGWGGHDPSDLEKAEFWGWIETILRESCPSARLVHGNANGPFFWNHKHVEIDGEEHVTLDLNMDGDMHAYTLMSSHMGKLNPESRGFKRRLAKAVMALHRDEPSLIARLNELCEKYKKEP